MSETAHTSNGCPDVIDDYEVKLARVMRRALKRAVDYAMRRDDTVAAANEALAILRAEFLWRFELLRSGPRKPILIPPEPLPLPPPSYSCQHLIDSCTPVTISQSNV